MNELVVYFYDNVVSIVYKDRVIKQELDSISEGLVVNRTSFMESFVSIIKKEKIKSKLFGDKIYVVKDAYFRSSDLFYLESMFMEMGFIKVIFKNIEELFYEGYTYIGVFQDYVVFYLDKPAIFDLTYFKDLSKLLAYFKSYYQEYVVLFGTNPDIPKISSNLINLYYIDHYQDYITQSLLKVNKCDV